MDWNTFQGIPFSPFRRNPSIAQYLTKKRSIICFMAFALSSACTKRPIDEESAELQRRANALEVTSLKQTVETLIKGLNSVEVITSLVKDVRIKAPNGGEVFLSKECNLNISVSLEGLLVIKTWGEQCKGFELGAGIRLPIQIQEISWDIRSASFSYRTVPQWTNVFSSVVTPLVNNWIKARLPESIRVLKTQFDLGNPEQTLQVLAPLLGYPNGNGIQAAIENMTDVTLRFTSRLKADTKIKLNRAELMISKDDPIEVQLSFTGRYDKRALNRVYIAAPGGVNGSSLPLKKKLGTILGSLAIARIMLITIDRIGTAPGNAEYEILAGTLFSAAEPWKFRSEKGKFSQQDKKRPEGTINDLMASEAPALLGAFRTLLKQAQPTFPVLLPAGIFRDL
jgi:hypothetical protein